jgi:hypothetical protein
MIFGLVFGGVGFLLMALALIFLVRTRILNSNSQQAQATITQMVYSSDSEGGGGYTPVFRFRTLQGQEVEVSGGLRTNPPQFKVGQTIDVLYDPDKPQKARIKKWFNLYFVPALLGFLGLVFGCGGIGSMIAAWFGVF